MGRSLAHLSQRQLYERGLITDKELRAMSISNPDGVMHDGRTRETHYKRMMNPDAWPAWPLCPLKKQVPKTEDRMGYIVGVLYDTSLVDGEPVVYLTNMFTFNAAQRDHEKLTYDSFSALLDDGWYVD